MVVRFKGNGNVCCPGTREEMENATVAILLQNLLARTPKLTDLGAITRLLIDCELGEDCVSDYTEKELEAEWHRPGFNLDSDAWVIVTYKGQFAGYADIWMCEHLQIDLRVRVHPNFRRRGIGTLLLRLAEDRARQYARSASTSQRITLRSAVSNSNQTAQQLLEHEGFMLDRHFWRMTIVSDEPLDGAVVPNMGKFDLYANVAALKGVSTQYQRTGIYMARQYDIYEKELRSGDPLLQLDDEMCLI
jgi:GNAT superfamily N-acetyltransferase